MDSWLISACNRLASDDFTILDDIRFDGGTFPVVARRTRFELTKVGFSKSFFIFGEFDRLTTEGCRAFSGEAYRYAKRNKTIPLPCGLFESVWSYAVAIARAVDERTLTSVRSDTPPKHWASAEVSVVYDLAQGKLFYFEETPLWGAAYYYGDGCHRVTTVPRSVTTPEELRHHLLWSLPALPQPPTPAA